MTIVEPSTLQATFSLDAEDVLTRTEAVVPQLGYHHHDPAHALLVLTESPDPAVQAVLQPVGFTSTYVETILQYYRSWREINHPLRMEQHYQLMIRASVRSATSRGIGSEVKCSDLLVGVLESESQLVRNTFLKRHLDPHQAFLAAEALRQETVPLLNMDL